VRILFDTHVFLWAISSDSRLSLKASATFADTETEALLSVATIWEILVKTQRGKLPFPNPAGPYLRDQIQRTSMSILPVALEHVLRIEKLPMHHRDPFDRILIAQAIAESVPIVTADRQFARYDVETIW
jgi:PIN domain nuclease of toxin-antitoxin system